MFKKIPKHSEIMEEHFWTFNCNYWTFTEHSEVTKDIGRLVERIFRCHDLKIFGKYLMTLLRGYTVTWKSGCS